MSWQTMNCTNCKRETPVRDYLRVTDKVVYKYNGCSYCGEPQGEVDIKPIKQKE